MPATQHQPLTDDSLQSSGLPTDDQATGTTAVNKPNNGLPLCWGHRGVSDFISDLTLSLPNLYIDLACDKKEKKKHEQQLYMNLNISRLSNISLMMCRPLLRSPKTRCPHLKQPSRMAQRVSRVVSLNDLPLTGSACLIADGVSTVCPCESYVRQMSTLPPTTSC
jgi:hypothetical protein